MTNPQPHPSASGTRSIGMALALCLAASPARADDLALRPAVDSATLGVALVLWVTPSLANRGLAGPACDPCDATGLNAWDRRAISNDSTAAATASDVLAVALPLTAAVGGLLHFPEAGWRGVGTDAFLILQSLAVNGAVNQLVRHAVRRPRPFMYVAGARDAGTRGDVEATLSFYSGHAATVFAAASAFSYLYFVRRPRSWTRFLVLGAALVAASAVPILRVAAGDHFPSDVLVGAAVGSAFGVLVPALHRRSAVTLAPAAGGAPGLSLAARF